MAWVYKKSRLVKRPDARLEFDEGIRRMAALADRSESTLMDIFPGMAADTGTRYVEGLFHRNTMAVQAGNLPVCAVERVARLAMVEIPGFP